MKKRFLLITLVLTMLLSAFALATNVFAEDCSYVKSGKNIAKDAAILASASATYLDVNKLVDGSGMTATWTGGGDFVFTFSEDKALTAVGLSINGYMTGSDGAFPTPNSWTYQQNQRPVAKVRVQFLSLTDEVIWDSQDLDTSNVNTTTTVSGFAPYMIQTPDVYVARKVRVVIYDSSWGKTPLGEVLIYEGSGAHDWSLTTTTTAPKCEEDGVGVYSCTCGAEKVAPIPATGHVPSIMFYEDASAGTHYNICEAPGCGERCYEKPHIYDDDCEDEDCNDCAAIRTAPGHIYTAECDAECDACSNGTRTPSASHVFDADCDLECNNCGSENPRYITCQYDNACDATCNNPGCTFPPREVPDHVYDSVCDADCNVCGFANPMVVDHKFTAECDIDCNWAGCTYVKTGSDVKSHTYTNNCDATCNKCSFNRGEREHSWTNDCDDICDICGTTRNTSHTWENDCDNICNVCQYERTISGHSYGTETTVVPPTATEVGYNKKICTICGVEELIEVPATGEEKDTGIPGWAIVLIVVGVVLVVAACAIIAVYVLVLKPKMEAKKKAELEAQKKAENDDEDEDEDDEDDEDEDDEESDEEESDEDEDEESND